MNNMEAMLAFTCASTGFLSDLSQMPQITFQVIESVQRTFRMKHHDGWHFD